jgi:HEAT repeat protein
VAQKRSNEAVEALITDALGENRDDESSRYWAIVTELRIGGEARVFERALALSRDPSTDARVLAANVLAQLGIDLEPRPFLGETIAVLRTLLDDGIVEVVRAAVHAFGHTNDPASVSRLVSFAAHEDASLRLAVACALGAYTEHEDAARALIALSADLDQDVRDWATFALGSLSELDAEPVREALVARLEDAHAATRLEAVTGLAHRRDARVIPALARVLAAGEAGSAVLDDLLEAAIVFESPALAPALTSLLGRAARDDVPLIERALEASRGRAH